MSEDRAMDIVGFLEARIAEDEKTAKALLRDLEGQIAEEYAGEVDEKGPMTPDRLLHAQMWAHYDGQSKRRSHVLSVLASAYKDHPDFNADWK